MKKMRWIALLLCLCMLLSACGDSSGGSNTTPGGGEASGPPAGNTDNPGTPGDTKLSGHLEVGVLLAEGTTGYNFIVGIGDELIAENPDLEIEYTFANTKARSFMEQRWRSNDAPDTDYFVFNAQVPSTYAFSDYLLDLTPYFEADPEWGNSFLDATTTVTSMDGKTFGVVTDTHVLGLYYNKAYFDQYNIAPPATWDDLLAGGAMLY